MRIFVFIFWGTLALTLNGQIGIGTSSPVSSAQLDVTSTSSGVLFPRMTNAQMLAISSPATGLQVFNTNANSLYTYNGSQWLSALNSYKTYANAGVNVQFDNLIIQMTSSGNRSVVLRTVSGSISISGTSTNLYISTSAGTSGSTGFISGHTRQSSSLSTTLTYWQSAADFLMHGSLQEIYLIDETNNRSYRILCIIGSGYLNNFFEIERMK